MLKKVHRKCLICRKDLGSQQIKALLRELIKNNSLQDSKKWESVKTNLFIITVKNFYVRTLKDHLFLMLNVWGRKDASNQKK